jgi:uncharacterized protein YndB with AHSA1/START domain
MAHRTARYNRTVTKAVKEEITLSRVFDAPDLVYRAFVAPDQLCLWKPGRMSGDGCMFGLRPRLIFI